MKPRLTIIAAALLAVALCPEQASAYASAEGFAAPPGEGGGGGRYFTGSIADGHDCSVCHGDVVGRLFVEGFPGTHYVPGESYEFRLGWPVGSTTGVAFEVVDSNGVGAGSLSVPDPESGESCSRGPATEVVALGDREVAYTRPCGARLMRLLWTAPSDGQPVWIHGAAVQSNGNGRPDGDPIVNFERTLAAEGTPRPERNVVVGCSAAESGWSSGWHWLLFALLVLAFRHPGRRRFALWIRTWAARGRSLHRAISTSPSALPALLHRTSQALIAVAWVVVATSGEATADDVRGGIYVRGDTDGIRVISPSAHANVRIGDRIQVSAGYAADIWTGASIDVRTAATRAIHEQRDELQGGAAYELDDITLRVDYRFSHETDYTSHAGSLDLTWRLAQNNATLRARLLAAADIVSRSGDEHFERELGSLGLQGVFTQNLNRSSLFQVAYELTRREGYQSSPYRFVAVSGDPSQSGLCDRRATQCLPETHPSLRYRNAAVVRYRRALGERGSLGLGYRFYVDDWGIYSNTGIVDGAWIPKERSLVSLRLRFYQQNGASFYRARYPERAIRFLTRDRELSPMFSTRLQVAYERTFDLSQAGPELKLTVGASATHLHYTDFVGLENVFAFDFTLSAEVIL